MKFRKLIKEAKQEEYIQTIIFEGSDRDNRIDKILDIFSKCDEGLLIFDENGEEPLVVKINKLIDLYYDFVDIEYIKDKQYKGKSPNFRGIILIKNTDDKLGKKIAISIKKTLENLGKLGNGGHSFDIIFYPISKTVKRKSFSWDGDGADRINIDSIEIK